MVGGGIRWMYDANRPAILKWNLVGLGVVWMATGRSGFKTVSIHAVRNRAAGFSNVKSIAYITLELLDKVHRLAVGMSSYRVSEVGTRAGERAEGRVNGAGLAMGSVAGLGAGVGGRIIGAVTSVHNKLAEVRGFAEGEREV